MSQNNRKVSGREDQRYVPVEDRDKARGWFEREYEPRQRVFPRKRRENSEEKREERRREFQRMLDKAKGKTGIEL